MQRVPHVSSDALTIRPALIEDAAAIRELLYAGADEFIVHEFSPSARQHYLDQLTVEKVGEKLRGDFHFYLATIGPKLAGVAAMRGNNHLYYLFVAKPFQRRGIARRLWQYVYDDALQRGNTGTITVNASNFAIAAYERLGFVRTRCATDVNGVRCNPMAFSWAHNENS